MNAAHPPASPPHYLTPPPPSTTAPTSISNIFQHEQVTFPDKFRIPVLNETKPLSLFYHADENLIHQIQALKAVRDTNSDKFRRRNEKVHRLQKILLECIHLIYLEMDSGLKAGREYRCSLPPEDQRELEGGFSENILFAAQALTRGFRIRGIEGFTAELVAPARQLCASMDALRLAFKRRAVLPPMSIAASTSREENNTIRLTTTPSSNTAAAGTAANDNISDSATASTTATTSTATNNYNTPLFVGNCLPEHGDLFPVLAEFDVAWTRFEQKICFCYFSVTYSGRPGRQDETDMFQVLLSETIIRAVNLKLVTNDQISNFDPVVMFAIPRLAIVAGLIHMPDCVNLTDAEGGFRWFRQKSFQMNYIKQELMLLNDADVVHLETMLVDSEPQCEREERRNGKMIMENVSDKSSDLNGLSSLLATLPLTEEGNMRSSEVEDGVNMEERNDDKDNQSPPLIDQQNLPLHQQEKESKQILFKHEPSSSECVKDVPIATYTTSSLTSTSSSTSQNQQHEYLSSTAAVATAATASEEPLSHFQDKSEKSTSILPPPSCISNQGKSREEKGKAVATGNQIDVGSYNVLMASSASPSSSSKASDTATYFKPAVPLDRLKCMYRAICAIADDLQSGPRAKEFVGVLQKTFSMHS